MERELDYLRGELKNAVKGLEEFQPLIDKTDVPIKTIRSPQEISDDIKIAGIQLSTLGEVSKDIEKNVFKLIITLSKNCSYTTLFLYISNVVLLLNKFAL